jgi:hypothetical protein
MEMAGFRFGSLASLLFFGCASVAAAQTPVFTKTSQIIDDTGNGVTYTPNTGYVTWPGVLGTTLNCCPNIGLDLTICTFSLNTLGGSPVETQDGYSGVPTPQITPIAAKLSFGPLTGPSQYTVSLSGRCYLQFNGHLYLPAYFTTSYSLIVEKPN